MFDVSLKTVLENLNLVKCYDKTNSNDFVFNLWEKHRWGLISFGQYITQKRNKMLQGPHR